MVTLYAILCTSPDASWLVEAPGAPWPVAAFETRERAEKHAERCAERWLTGVRIEVVEFGRRAQ